jgi:hypothetical protein
MSERESAIILRLPITHPVSEKGKEMSDATERIVFASHVLDRLPLTRSVVLLGMERLLLVVFLPHFCRCLLPTTFSPLHA